MAQLKVKSRKQHVRLWFEYYRLCHQSNKYSDSLRESLDFYSDWDYQESERFDDWWIRKSDLFGSGYVREVSSAGQSPDTITVEIPIDEPVTKVMDQIRDLLKVKQEERNQQTNNSKDCAKTKVITFRKYKFTNDKELRGSVLHETLMLLKYWIELDSPPINEQLVLDIRSKLLNRKNSKWVPFFMVDPNIADISNVVRQLRRRLKRGENICHSVASGEFPGDSTLS